MNSYREKKERERLLFSCLTVFGSTVLIFLVLFLLDLLKFEDFNEYTGPVKITFGSPDGVVQNEPVKEPIIEKPEEDITPIEEVSTEPEPVVESEILESTSEEIKNDIPRIEETEKTEIIKKVIEKPVVEPVPVILKGRESGNSHETSFESSSSTIGRSGYIPISYYMPVPETILFDIFAFIRGSEDGLYSVDENKIIFEKYYFNRGSYFELNSSVPLQYRPELWDILQRAGYDVDNAEYKSENNLKTVIISFEINSNSDGISKIESAKIESTSGDKNIDEAVLYGFRQSTYSNSTSESVKGRFKYTFK